MLRSRADNGKKTALVSRGKSRAKIAASVPPKLSHEEKLIRQLHGLKNCRLTDLRPSWFYPTTRQYPCKHLGYLADKKRDQSTLAIQTAAKSPLKWITLKLIGWKPLALKDTVAVPERNESVWNKSKLTVALVGGGGGERCVTTLKTGCVADYCSLNLRSIGSKIVHYLALNISKIFLQCSPFIRAGDCCVD